MRISRPAPRPSLEDAVRVCRDAAEVLRDEEGPCLPTTAALLDALADHLPVLYDRPPLSVRQVAS